MLHTILRGLNALIISMIILLISYSYHRKLDKREKFVYTKWIYTALILCDGFIILIANGSYLKFGISIEKMLEAGILVCLGLIALLWPLNACVTMEKEIKKYYYFILPLLAVGFICSLVCGFNCEASVCFLLALSGLSTVIMGLTGRGKLIHVKKEVYNQMILASVFVVIGSILQILFWNLYFSISFITVSLLIILLNSQYNKGVLDKLTRLHNRYGLDEEFEEQLRQYRRDNNDSFCLIACDMDNFKAINDENDHDTGDAALKIVADVLVRAAEDNDAMAFRNGGDEFVIITDKADKKTVDKICNRIETELSKICFKDKYELKMSMGYAVFEGKEDIEELMIRADQFLYDEKRRRKKDETYDEEC